MLAGAALASSDLIFRPGSVESEVQSQCKEAGISFLMSIMRRTEIFTCAGVHPVLGQTLVGCFVAAVDASNDIATGH